MTMNDAPDNDSHTAAPRSVHEAIKVCFRKYATFSGRASCSEFWRFYLGYCALLFVVDFSVALGMEIVGYDEQTIDVAIVMAGILVSLVFLLPASAVNARRLHDIGRSGWWQLLNGTLVGIPLVIHWWAKEGNPERNKFDGKVAERPLRREDYGFRET